MADVKEILSRKYGPLPAWGWAALGIGVVVLYRYYAASKTAAPAAGTTAATIAGPANATPTAGAGPAPGYGGTADSSLWSQLLDSLAGIQSSLSQLGSGPTNPGGNGTGTTPALPTPAQYEAAYNTQNPPLRALTNVVAPATQPAGATSNVPSGYSVLQTAQGWVNVPPQYVQNGVVNLDALMRDQPSLFK